MAQGKKYGDDIKERAYALLAVNNNVQAVADEMKLPYSTVNNWRMQWLKQRSADKQSDTKNLEEVRNKNKEKFANKAWGIIINSANLAERKVSRALYLEERIDAVADAISKHSESIARETGIAWDSLVALVKELKGFKAMRLGELSTIINVMYDKQALINKDPTSITEAKKFEDFN